MADNLRSGGRKPEPLRAQKISELERGPTLEARSVLYKFSDADSPFKRNPSGPFGESGRPFVPII